jgi:AraC-like DNA-binding protein
LEYREYQPPPALRGTVRCIWHLRDAGGGRDGATDRVVPDGCAEIIVNRAERFRRHVEGAEARRQPEVLLVGQLRSAIRIEATGRVDLLAVRFEPSGLHALLGVPMHELTDLDVSLEQVDAVLRARLREAAHAVPAPRCVAALERVLCERMRPRPSGGRAAALVTGALARFDASAGSVEAVARGLGSSRRSLERAFRERVGLSPKQYRRVVRLQGVVQALQSGAPLPGWAALAHDHGFFDQAHLIRDFRLIAGISPQRYLAEETPIADLLTGGDLSHSSNP